MKQKLFSQYYFSDLFWWEGTKITSKLLSILSVSEWKKILMPDWSCNVLLQWVKTPLDVWNWAIHATRHRSIHVSPFRNNYVTEGYFLYLSFVLLLNSTLNPWFIFFSSTIFKILILFLNWPVLLYPHIVHK